MSSPSSSPEPAEPRVPPGAATYRPATAQPGPAPREPATAHPRVLAAPWRAWLWVRDLHRDTYHSGAFLPTAPSLVFLLALIVPAWMDEPAWLATCITVLAVLVGLNLVYAAGVSLRSPRARTLWLIGAWLVTVLLGLTAGWNVLYLCMYTIVVHGMLLPWRATRIAVPAIGAAYVIAGLLTDNYFAAILAIAGVAMALALAYAIDRARLERRLKQAEVRNATLAVAAERERIGRDLHDILGHSLTTVTTLAQLGRRLAHSDPDAAAEQFEQIEQISRQALGDVRATASNIRQVSAAAEVASARSVLEAAGITAQVPAAVPELDTARAELFGYVIREGVTNVVRHSHADRCTIAVDTDAVTISDNGTGVRSAGKDKNDRRGRGRPRSPGTSVDARLAVTTGRAEAETAGEPPGSGIAGLRARVLAAGGELHLESAADGTGTVLSVHMTGGQRA